MRYGDSRGRGEADLAQWASPSGARSSVFQSTLGRYGDQQCGNIHQVSPPLIAAEGFCLSRPYQRRVLRARVDR